MVYQITFYVATPVIVTTQLHLDAILAAVHPAMHNIGGLTRRSDASKIITAPLPLDSAKIGQDWVWCCTAADYGDNAEPFCDKIAKRKNGTDYLYINSRQTPRSGPGRDRCDTIHGVVCGSVSFFASTGNARELERICKRVKSIGGLRKMGYGQVGSLQISDTSMDWTECLVCNGVAGRNLPQEFVEEECKGRVPTTSPYWLGKNLRLGVETGEPATLKKDVWLNAYKRN